MTGAEMVEDVCGPLSYNKDDTTHQTRALRWLNDAAKWMARFDFPELVTHDASFTTTGADSYDMTAEGFPGSTFFRIVEGTVRIARRNLILKTKAWRDSVDPDYSDTGEADFYGIEDRKYFWLYRKEGAGSTVKFDWVKYPAAIANDTAEADVTFQPEHHNLLVRGAIWRGKQYIGDTDWLGEKLQWEKDVKNQYKSGSAPINVTGDSVTPIMIIDF